MIFRQVSLAGGGRGMTGFVKSRAGGAISVLSLSKNSQSCLFFFSAVDIMQVLFPCGYSDLCFKISLA